MSRRPLPAPGRPAIMGVLNLTPDSFSDGGRFADPDAAVARAVSLERDGAAVLDLGAASSRPGATPVPPDEEWLRLEPVLARVRAATRVPISLDTTSAEVLRRAARVGVDLVNDTSALADDPGLAAEVAALGLPVVLMHRRGTPETMQDDPRYDDAAAEVADELRAAVARAAAAGIPRERVLLDPGIGFGKRLEDNLALLAALPALRALGHRLVLGCSRKAFLGALTGRPVGEREHATTATTVLGALAGVDLLRVHDVGAASDALAVVAAVARGGTDAGSLRCTEAHARKSRSVEDPP